MCQERDHGPIHLFDNRVWTVKDAYTYCTTGHKAVPESAGQQDQSLAAVMMRSKSGTAGGSQRDQQPGAQQDQTQDGGQDPKGSSKKKQKK